MVNPGKNTSLCVNLKDSEISVGFKQKGSGKEAFVEPKVDFHSFLSKLEREYLGD